MTRKSRWPDSTWWHASSSVSRKLRDHIVGSHIRCQFDAVVCDLPIAHASLICNWASISAPVSSDRNPASTRSDSRNVRRKWREFLAEKSGVSRGEVTVHVDIPSLSPRSSDTQIPFTTTGLPRSARNAVALGGEFWSRVRWRIARFSGFPAVSSRSHGDTARDKPPSTKIAPFPRGSPYRRATRSLDTIRDRVQPNVATRVYWRNLWREGAGFNRTNPSSQHPTRRAFSYRALGMMGLSADNIVNCSSATTRRTIVRQSLLALIGALL